jgi:hypothetical protein
MGYIKYFLVSVLLGGLTFTYNGGTNVSNTAGCSMSTYLNQHSVAIDSQNRVHIAWSDQADTNTSKSLNMSRASLFTKGMLSKNKDKTLQMHLFYSRSLDGGSTFSDTLRLSDSLYSMPTIATNNLNVVHILYSKEDTEFNYYIHYAHSADGGNIWKDTVLQTLASTSPGSIAIATSGDNIVHAAWSEFVLAMDTYYKFSYTHSFNSGAQWSSPVESLTTANIVSMPDGSVEPYPAISASGNRVHLVWQDSRDDSAGEIYYKRSTDSGKVWGPDVRLTTDTYYSVDPTVASNGNSVYVGWIQCDRLDSVFSYYIRYSSDGGTNWDAPVCMIPRAEDIYLFGGIPQININNNTVAIVYCAGDSLAGNPVNALRVKYSKNNGLIWSSMTVFQDSIFCPLWASAVIDSSNHIHIAFSGLDSSMENPDIYYAKVSLNAVEEKLPVFGVQWSVKIFPNPVSKFANISYALPVKSSFSLKVYSVSGREVRTIFNGEQCAGEHRVTVSTKGLSSGVYFVRLETNGHTINKRLIVLK